MGLTRATPVAADAPSAGAPIAVTAPGFMIATANEVDEIKILRVAPGGKRTVLSTTKLGHGANPVMTWLDPRTLLVVEPRQVKQGYEDVARWFVDGKLDGIRTQTISSAAWPAEARVRPTTRAIVTKSGELWLGRSWQGLRPNNASVNRDDPRPGRSEAFLRVAPTPGAPAHVASTQPADADPVRSTQWFENGVVNEGVVHAWVAALPVATPPTGLAVVKIKVKVRGTSWAGVACTSKPARTTYPNRATSELTIIDAQDVKFASSTLPLYAVTGPRRAWPAGEYVNTDWFLGCTRRPLGEARWLGGDRWATRVDMDDRWIVWDGGLEVARIAGLGVRVEFAPW